MYLFTNKKLEVLEARDLSYKNNLTPGENALQHRKKLGKDVIVWVSVGGDNPVDKINWKSK